MCFKADCMLTALTLTLVWTQALTKPSGKGSDSLYSSGEVVSDEDDNKAETQNKQTGHQRKFWIPTYHGNNPLNRRKIGITTSEIEKYDKSIDVSLSGVGKKKNVSNHKNTYDVPSMPFLWSGDGISSNNTNFIPLFNSEAISLEDSLKNKFAMKQKLQINNNNKDISENKTQSIGKRKKSTEKRISSEISTLPKSYHDRFINKTKDLSKGGLKKEKVSQLFFDELYRAQQNESRSDSNYYKKLVKTATENTKQKLGYKKIIPHQPSNDLKFPTPKIFSVDLDKKQTKSSVNQDKIGFSTRHEQAGGMDKEFDHKLKPRIGHSSTTLKSSFKPRVGTNTSSNRTIDKITHNTTGARIERYYKTINNASKITVSLENLTTYTHFKKDDSLSEFGDYSAWSDVIYLNKTQKKGKKRKSKTGKAELLKAAEEDRSIPQWSKKGLKTKADELRTKQGKITRQEKKQRAVKKRDSNKLKKKFYERADYENLSDDPNKSLRMRTPAEKRHAINSVRNYLQEADKKYNRRPGKSQRERKSNRYDTSKDKWNRNDRDYSYGDQGEDYRERGDRWRPREDRRSGGGGRWGNQQGSRRGREEYRDRGPPIERSWSNRGGRGRGFQRGNYRNKERAGRYDFDSEVGRYGNDRREYKGRQGRQGRNTERYSNYGRGRKRGDSRGDRGRRRRGS